MTRTGLGSRVESLCSGVARFDVEMLRSLFIHPATCVVLALYMYARRGLANCTKEGGGGWTVLGRCL